MFEKLQGFSPSDYLPHGFCMKWQNHLILLHVLSDAAIALAYFSIPWLLFHFVKRRKDLQPAWIFLLFAGFIASCGFTHIMGVITLWEPLYFLEGVIKAFTAVVSVITAVSLGRLMPRFLKLPSPQQLQRANDDLKAEFAQRAKTEEALAKSEAHFRNLANAMPQIVWAADAEGHINYANDRWYEFAGLPSGSDPARLQDLEQSIHREDRPQFLAAQAKANGNQESYQIEFRLWDHVAHGYRWFLARAVPTKDRNGTVDRWFGTFTDIHELKEVESKLRAREQQLSILFETQSMADWTWDVDKDELIAHPMFWKLYGEAKPLDSVQAEWCKKRWHPDDIRAIEQATRLAIDEDVPLDIEFRIIWPDASAHWLACRGIVIRDADGKPIRTSGMVIDVTEQKRQEERLRAVVEATPNAMILAADDEKIAFANSQAEKLFGYKRGELVGRNVDSLWLRDARGEQGPGLGRTESIQAITRQRDPYGQRRDGSCMPIEIRLTPITLQEGDFTLVSILDKTDQRKASETEQMFRSLVSSVKDYAIYMLDRDGIILSWNEGAERTYGYQLHEVIGKTFELFYLPEDVEAGIPERKLSVALAQNKFSGEAWRVRRDGSRFLASITITPVFDLEGRHTGFCNIVHDITEKKAAEEALRKSEQELRLLADVMPQIVWRHDSRGRLTYCNGRWYEFSGTQPRDEHNDSPQAAIDQVFQMVHSGEVHLVAKKWTESLASGAPFEEEYRLWDYRRKEHRWHLGRAMPVKNENGEIFCWMGTATDIHEQKRAAEKLEAEVQKRTAELSVSLSQLRASEETLLASLNEKEILLKEIHHRVKNNLQIISSLLSMQADSVQDSDAVAKLLDSERRVMSMALIHEQLYSNKDMSMIDFADYVSKLAPSVLSSARTTRSVLCRLNLKPVTLSIEQAIPCGLILNELITNALKYAYPEGEEGEVLVALEKDEESVTMMVSDQGIGLPPDFSFENAKTLGLKIVQVLTKQVHGILDVNRGRGTTFVLRFPAAA